MNASRGLLLAAWIALTMVYVFLRVPSDPLVQLILADPYGGLCLGIGYFLAKRAT